MCIWLKPAPIDGHYVFKTKNWTGGHPHQSIIHRGLNFPVIAGEKFPTINHLLFPKVCFLTVGSERAI